MTALTVRGELRYPEPADNSRNVRTDIKNLADDVAAKVALYVEGTAGTRPSPGVAGRLHRATDTGVVSWDTGSSWDDVAVSRAGGSTITSATAATKGLVIKGASGQTANLAEFQASDGSTRLAVNSSGTPFRGSSWVFNDEAVENARFTTATAAKIGFVVRGAASQTANLAEFQNSAGTVLSGVTAAGRVLFNETPAASATAGVNGATPAQVGGYITVSVQGVDRKVPYYNV